ncbi:glycosyltransferase family 2 protein [Planomonospora parontospora]|uniref:glycosyltransferase family 2 protein n=1 Tax=Planomonospora parontospora TaxID=58119 RepID=UPI00178645AC|nr:glycosyltransferase family 2 protein [Planomonospora parontospora]
MDVPVVSVIVAVHDVEAYLGECLDSVVGQSIGLERLEVVAVDDGSTDGSGAVLDGYARRHPEIRAVHQAASGGPGGPRNTGLGLARGRYVFFLDSDDYLGPQALERLVAAAERNGSDVVLGRMAGVGGRRVPRTPFARNRDRADLYRDGVYYTLSAQKLFRRDLVERLGLRFPEHLRTGEDQPFTALAYLGARVISVVADYDCYYLTYREGVRNASRSAVHPLERLPQVAEVMELVERHTPPGEERDRLMMRHFRCEVLSGFGPRWRSFDRRTRDRVTGLARPIVDRWATAWIMDRLPPADALRAHCIRHGLRRELDEVAGFPAGRAYGAAVVEGGRIFAAYPGFRAGLPDRLFEITGRVRPVVRLAALRAGRDGFTLEGAARLEPEGLPAEAELILRRRGDGLRLAFPLPPGGGPRSARLLPPGATGSPLPAGGGPPAPSGGALPAPAGGGFRAVVAGVPPGTWDVSVVVGCRGLTREVRLNADRHGAPRIEGASRTNRLFFTVHGNLSVEVSGPTGWIGHARAALRHILKRDVCAM